MRIGWLHDQAGYVGGAELTQAEFRDAATADIAITDCPPGAVDPDCDRYVIHNCVQYRLEDFEPITGKPCLKFWHDVGPWVRPDVREWLDSNTTAVCCSPIQAEHMQLPDALLIPPPVNLERFAAASSTTDERAGVVSIAAWRNHDKAPHRVAEWSIKNETHVDFYGGGELAPLGSEEVAYEQMPVLLSRYETFVFLPTTLEPFGRLVAEAWAAGCQIVTNNLVGARYWIEERPEAIETATTDFWDAVLERVTA